MATIDGGPDNDRLAGAAEDDLIRGFDGDDTLIGAAGNDTLIGGVGTISCRAATAPTGRATGPRRLP